MLFVFNVGQYRRVESKEYGINGKNIGNEINWVKIYGIRKKTGIIMVNFWKVLSYAS